MIRYIWLFSLCFSSNSIDKWVDAHQDILSHNLKSASFQIEIDSKSLKNLSKTNLAKIIIADKNKFRLELENRTIVSNGEFWKIYDILTDQIFLQEPDSDLESALFSWINPKKLKAIPIKKINSKEFKIILFNKNNNVRTFFNNQNNLEYILVLNEDSQIKISKIKLQKEDELNLNVGSINSEIFDLR